VTLQELCDRAIFVAYGSVTPSGEDPIVHADLQAEALAPHAMAQVTKEILDDPERAHLLMQEISITMVNGIGDIPPLMLTQYMDEASVRDSNVSANSGFGNVLVRIHQFNDFIEWHFDPRFGYYCLQDAKIFNIPIGSSIVSGNGLLHLWVPMAISADNIELASDEITEDVIIVLARLLREGVQILSQYKTLTFYDRP
jgi:hypothetical protein